MVVEQHVMQALGNWAVDEQHINVWMIYREITLQPLNLIRKVRKYQILHVVRGELNGYSSCKTGNYFGTCLLSLLGTCLKHSSEQAYFDSFNILQGMGYVTC